MVQFGKECRQKYFSYADPEALLTNHGSYGLTPDKVLDACRKYQNQDAAFPDKYLSFDHPAYYEQSVKKVIDYVHAPPNSIALVDNVTTGVAAVLHSILFKPEDRVVVSSIVYPSNLNFLRHLQRTQGFQIDIIDINVPEMTNKDIIDALRAELEKGSVKLVLFDSVTSMPAIRLPWEEAIELCREYKAQSLIDAAHGIGMYPIDFRKHKPDYLTTNLHKWFFAPRPNALLYVAEEHRAAIQPFPLSHYYETDDKAVDTLVKKFTFVGSKNYANIAAVSEALDFVEEIGGLDAIMAYHSSLKAEVKAYLAKRYTGLQFLNDSDDKHTSLLSFYYPLDLFATQEQIDSLDKPEFCMDIKKAAVERKAYFQLSVYRGKIFWRFSFQIYNSFEDYVRAADVLEDLLKEYFQKSSSSK